MERTAGPRDSELVRQTAELLSLGGPLPDLFERFCTLLARFVDASVVFIALDSPSGVHIEFVYDHGLSMRDAHVPVRPQSQTFRVMHTGESLLMRGPDDLPQIRVDLQIPGAGDDDTVSAIFVPLRYGTRPVGVLSVQSGTPGAYDEHDLQLLETCALYVAVGMKRAFADASQSGGDGFATTDGVTGTATRRVFEEHLANEWQHARRFGTPVAIILMDIDRFKSFNDTYGHVAGDSCLAQIAQAARSCVSRRSDLFARYGGEEFAAILRDVPAHAATVVAERMRKAVSDLQVPHARNSGAIVTASFGVACAHANGEDPRSLLRRADRALYAAKTSGRNRVVLETPQQIDEYPHTGGNLPPRTTPTIGRTIELDALARSLAISRLTTVVGPGGTGKTHCALAVADQLMQAYVHGAWFFDFSLVRDEADIDAVLSAATTERLAAHRRPRDAVLNYFAHKHCLIVLDNCEHVSEEVAALCAGLLAQAPRTTILATSRRPLKLAEERVFHLSPLTREDAEALFLSRARAASPASIFDARERAEIRDLCGHLDDLPLAIEMAASRCASFLPATMLSALRNQPRTLEATIAWSYALLDERAQRLFERLSVFGRTFDAEAARDICGCSPLRPGEAAAAFDEIVERRLAVPAHVWDDERFMLLQPMRDYAAQRLRERGEESFMYARHAEYYLAAARRLSRHRAREWAEFRMALERSFAAGSPTAAELVLALRGWWTASGRTREARVWSERALHAAAPADPHRGELLYAAAAAAQSDGDFHAVRDYASELLALAQDVADHNKLGRACDALGTAEKHLGNAKAAQQWYASALAHYRIDGDRRSVGAVLLNLGTAAADILLDFASARTYFLEALQIFRELELPPDIGIALACLADISGQMSDYETALTYASESLSVFERLRKPCAQAWQLVSIAHYRIERQEWERAASALRGAHAILQEHPHREYAALLLEVGLYLAGDLQRDELAARIAGYLHLYREREAVPRLPSAQRHYDGRVQRARRRLGTPAFETAYASGPSYAPDALVADVVRP
ncbi:MAG TPA: diguanylate cyclase [Candidatus Baltobacteraceae bacterium]|nr:diguanylate cyclase [Candidatus Baltobacteraceae bacterium]